MDAAKRGSTALDASNYEVAIKEYTSALKEMPNAVDYYLKRSTAYQRSSPPHYEQALEDVELAVHLAVKRAKRELIGQAQLRRAILLFNMGNYADAEFILQFVKKYDEKNKTLAIWESKIAQKLKALPEGDEARIVKAKEVPEIKASEKKEVKEAIAQAPTAKVITQTPPSQIKHDWYQSKDSVYFTLLAKGVPKELATIEIDEHSVTHTPILTNSRSLTVSQISISFPTQTGSTFTYSLDPLFAPIDAKASTSNITATKVELILKKQTPGRQWKSLEGIEAPAITDPSTNSTEDPIRQAVLADATAKPPAYPTSSKHGPKNWDKLVDNLSKNKEDPGDVGDLDDDGGDPTQAFFKQLYAGADEDTRRAINKSYQESGGTVLSTNWAEVGQKKVEVSPPDGMEAKKWSA
jgi:suppressor of G2 allele of SKP1